MANFLKRWDLMYTLAFFLLMVPAEHFESFSLLEDETLGWRQLLRWQFAEPADIGFRTDEIALISTDEQFYEDYGGFPLRRVDYGQLAINLKELGASVVAIDAAFDYPNSYGGDDEAARLMAEAGNVLLVSTATIGADQRQFIELNYPIRKFRDIATTGYTNISSASSLVSRMTRLRIFPEATREEDGWPFAIQALALHWKTEPQFADGVLTLGDTSIPLDHDTDLYIDFPPPAAGAESLSEQYGLSVIDYLDLDEFSDDELADMRYEVEDKIVLVGDISALSHDIFDTPIGQVYGVEIIAKTIHTMLQGAPLRPASLGAEAAVSLVVMALLMATSLLLHPAPRLLATAVLAGAYIAFMVVLYTQTGTIFSMAYTLLAIGVGTVLINTRYYFLTDEDLMETAKESAESNRMLGLAYQGQGQLDMAFDKFRRLPVDDAVLDLLFNLSLDYERKRQFAKAVSVYEYIAENRSGYRDVDERLARARGIDANPLAAQTMAAAGTIVTGQEGVEKPTLGRYEVESELGQGAMGIVYLGTDPKINRTVAIKTMSLAQEFEPDVLEEVKSRFFREAESAGRLNHPNIVQIYDAGDEHDLAYISMEFLKGHDLAEHTREGALLPLAVVLDVVAQCADALDYAHREGVVHRDIKPANIMYDPDTQRVKITDFGIARITDSTKTKTGTVLGTPNYMSPEQALGDKVDGRSDLFSLGIVLYQLASGHLPFDADSMAALLYKIVNEPHPDITTYVPDVPAPVRKIVNNALGKKPESRYQTGAQLADHLRRARQRLEGDAA